MVCSRETFTFTFYPVLSHSTEEVSVVITYCLKKPTIFAAVYEY
jgi:hypothetical protein